MDEFGTLLKGKLFEAAKEGKFGPVSQAAAEIGEKYEYSDEDLSNFIALTGEGDGEEVERIINEALSAFATTLEPSLNG